MPTIQIKSAVQIDSAAREAIKTELGKAIELIPGKSEAWLMVLFGSCQELFFKGVSDPKAALVEVGIKGQATKDEFGALGAAITTSLAKHAPLDPARIYISYSEFDTYSWNGGLL